MGAELIFRRGTPPDAEYTFKHALVQDAANSTLLRSQRQHLHSRSAATLESRFPEIVTSEPATLAWHCTEGALAEKAIGYWLTAGQQSAAHSAMAEAVAQFQKGLEVLAALPDSLWRQQQQLDLLIALGPAMIATKGYAAPEVGETITRARALAAQLDRLEYLVPLLYGEWGFHGVRSEPLLALSCAEQIEAIGGQQKNTAVLLLGYLYQAIIRFTLGEFARAYSLLEQCRKLNDPDCRAAKMR